MAYTVKKLAQLSGVSIRTLHFYDEVGLLRPAYHGSNGYRYYEEPQLLALQQILFFRELGFELKQIQKILGRGDFDKLIALNAHRKVLEKDLLRIRKLIKTIDKTTEHLKGTKKMKDKEMYHGFITKEQHVEYQKYIKNRFGEEQLIECEKNVKDWTKSEWEVSKKEMASIIEALAKAWGERKTADSLEVQRIITKHYNWLKKFWTPNKDSYTGLGQMYMELEWEKVFEPYDSEHPKLAGFLAEGMKVFALKQLS